ncbi:hypothetical protein A3860_12600 [Niastella vici]|uniref:Glucose-methanol-choline oxidoreductase C-terminal domain-containing protein n=1 Tax=Niastella vici TaxID=1703345 RepID=A0A1V9G6X6_9BACT|nr:family 16 glycoside hydrolase [Niastella vici]OQP66337.1 hypothetical protein A3860_12600 [Niastella vici]
MSLTKLIVDPNQTPANFDIQGTTFSFDVLGRYVCNTWQEIKASLDSGGYPFDVVIIGGGMFGSYAAEKFFRTGKDLGLRILVIEAGDFLLPSHIQNLPQKLGGKIGGPDGLRNTDDGNAQNVIWGMPWISNEAFPGLAYCVGGRSIFWGGWSPRLTDNDLLNWPTDVSDFLKGVSPVAGAYTYTEKEIGVNPSTDYIVQASAYNTLDTALKNAMPGIPAIKAVAEAPLAVQGSSPGPGLFPFDKFSSCPFLIDAIRDDIASNNSHGDVSRRIFLLPKTQVLQLNKTGSKVTSIDISTNGQRQTIFLADSCSVILANGTIEATRIALESLGIGSTQFGAPRVGNLMAHLRSNITVRIKRSALGLPTPATNLETTAHIVKGEAFGRRFHLQVTAAAIAGPDPEKNMWSMVPDIDLQANMLANQDPDWMVITFRGIGEMEDDQSLTPDPNKSWIDLSNETDRWGKRRAYVHLVVTANDRKLWTEMDKTAFDLASVIAGNAANIQYWNSLTKSWQPQRPQPDANGKGFWQDKLGTTHHEAGTLFMGAPGSSITDTNGKFHNTDNVYVAGPAVFPSLGSANPSLTAFSLARKTVQEINRKNTPIVDNGFTPLSLAAKDWQMVSAANTAPFMKNYGKVLETIYGYGLYWYVKEQFSNFILKIDWRTGRRDDNSGIYIRIPAFNIPNALQSADSQGHEIEIDERGFDSQNNSEGNWIKINGAIYDLQAPARLASNAVGQWNTYIIEANGPQIQVTLNGQLVNTYTSNRQLTGYIALQAHHDTSRVQFRNLLIKKLP